MEDKGITYSDSGVDIDKGNELVSRIKEKVKETHTSGVIGDLGGFGGLFAPDFKELEEPVLVAGTDGVGTKLKIAQKMGIHDTIGIDLVAMCVNDILAQGAVPLFFLDYMASGKLNLKVSENIVNGIVKGCKQAQTALIGGETAEMPDFYAENEYEVAGFAVGMVDKNKIITGENIKNGDILLGFPSSGVHSNGFSLIRYLINKKDELNLEMEVSGIEKSLGKELLTPTRIYVKTVLPLINKFNIKGISHITGGGLIENLPRIIPESLQAEIEVNNWPSLPIFDFVQKQGKVKDKEMFKTFNMGIGLVLIISPEEEKSIKQTLKQQGEEVYTIGEVVTGKDEVVLKNIKEGDDD
ncbi:MAG: phosphoribosylformylglycinamidine cyclo-ligase [Halanaerobiales bacterium]